MFHYRLIEQSRPTLWHVVPPLLGIVLLALLLLVAAALFSWWGLLGAGLVLGVALYFLGMARWVAVLDELAREG